MTTDRSVLIRNALVLEATEGELRCIRADLLVELGRIAAIAPPGSVATGRAAEVIEGERLLVAPGCINGHATRGTTT